MTDRNLVNLETPSGYQTHDTYFATRYVQGGRDIYSIDLSLPQLVQTIPRPDPSKSLEGNRQVSMPRARSFGEYLRDNANAIYPPLLLQAPSGEFEFEVEVEVGGTQFGYLKIPRVSRGVTRIVDGQHRSLGSHLCWETLEEDIRRAREQIAMARRAGERDLVTYHERELNRLLATRDRLSGERIALDIVIVDDPDEAHQIFVDIADNAKGITRDLTAMFDQRKAVNRVMQEVIKHELLFNRVDEGRAGRMGKNSSNLIGAKNVADIVRSLQVGTGRVGAKLERQYAAEEQRLVAETIRFLDVLVRVFPELQDVVDGSIGPADLRKRSLLGSATMLRVFALVHYELTKNITTPFTNEEVAEFYKTLAPHMGVPVEGMWRDTGVFLEANTAPGATQGAIRKLTDTIVNWARNGLPSG
jgi:DNA-sulfur modification-associated